MQPKQKQTIRVDDMLVTCLKQADVKRVYGLMAPANCPVNPLKSKYCILPVTCADTFCDIKPAHIKIKPSTISFRPIHLM